MHWLSPILLYGNEIWTFTKRDKKRLASTDISFFRITSGCTFFDYIQKEEVLEEFKVEPTDEKPRRYKSNRLRHVTRTNNNRMPKIMLNYRPNERKWLGRPLSRLIEEAETNLSRPYSWWMMMMMMMMVMMINLPSLNVPKIYLIHSCFQTKFHIHFCYSAYWLASNKILYTEDFLMRC
jgi:hypothetical protein